MGQDAKRVLVVDSGPDDLDQPLKKARGSSGLIPAQLASSGALSTLPGNSYLGTHFAVCKSTITLYIAPWQSDMYVS